MPTAQILSGYENLKEAINDMRTGVDECHAQTEEAQDVLYAIEDLVQEIAKIRDQLDGQIREIEYMTQPKPDRDDVALDRYDHTQPIRRP